MAATFRENTNAFLVVQGFPNMMIEFMILEFRDHFEFRVRLDRLNVGLGRLDLLIIDNFIHPNLLFLYFQKGFHFNCSKLSPVSINFSRLDFGDGPNSFLRHILSSLEWYCP